MIGRRKYIFLLCLFLTGAIFGAIWFRSKPPEQPVVSPASSFFDVSPILLDGYDLDFSYRNGEIRGGEEMISPDSEEGKRIVKLLALREMYAASPILFSRTTDPDKLLVSVRNLRDQEKEILTAFGWQDGLFPDDFLERYALTSGAWQRFESEVSEKNARELLSLQTEALQAYERDLEKLKRKMEDLKKNGLPILATADYVTLGGETSTNLEIIISDLAIMQRNADLLKDELARTKKCWEEGRACREDIPVWPDLASEKEKGVKLFDKKKLGLQDAIGPLAVSSACWKLEGPAHIYTFTKCPEEMGFCFSDSQLADKMYFTRLGDYYPYDVFLRSKGVEAVPQNATTPYECNNLEYYAELNVLGYAKRAISISNLEASENIPSDLKNKLNEIKALEENFINSEVKDIRDIQKLQDAYGYLYFALREKEPAAASYFLERYIYLKERSVGLDLSINKIAAYLRNFRESFAQKNGTPSEGYVYAIRNAYSLLFLNFSPTIWVSNERPQYLESRGGLRGEVNSVMDYGTAVDRYGEERLFKWVEVFRREDKFRFYSSP